MQFYFEEDRKFFCYLTVEKRYLTLESPDSILVQINPTEEYLEILNDYLTNRGIIGSTPSVPKGNWGTSRINVLGYGTASVYLNGFRSSVKHEKPRVGDTHYPSRVLRFYSNCLNFNQVKIPLTDSDFLIYKSIIECYLNPHKFLTSSESDLRKAAKILM